MLWQTEVLCITAHVLTNRSFNVIRAMFWKTGGFGAISTMFWKTGSFMLYEPCFVNHEV